MLLSPFRSQSHAPAAGEVEPRKDASYFSQMSSRPLIKTYLQQQQGRPHDNCNSDAACCNSERTVNSVVACQFCGFESKQCETRLGYRKHTYIYIYMWDIDTRYIHIHLSARTRTSHGFKTVSALPTYKTDSKLKQLNNERGHCAESLKTR